MKIMATDEKSDNEIDDENHLVDEAADNVCTCALCPKDPIEHSKCCHLEGRIKSELENESVNCVVALKKMTKLWDKVVMTNL